MNIFNRILNRELDRETRVGIPAGSPEAIKRRINLMFAMTGGRGFRQPKKGPKLSRGGKTRKERIADKTFQPLLLKVCR